jgi:membrane protease YdiL (CAAX protease family)
MSDDTEPELPSAPAPAAPPQSAPAVSRPGASIFTIEGRAAPGLFVVGWLASILGLSLTLVGLLGASRLLFFVVGPALLSVGLICGAGNQALERRARGEAYAGPSPLLAFGATIAVTYLVGALIGLGLEAVAGSGSAAASPAGQLVAGLLTAAVFIGMIRLVVVGTGALTWAEMGVRRFDRQALNDLGLGVAVAFPVIVVTAIVAALLVAIFPVQPTSPLPPTGELSGLAVQLLAGALIAPIAEELFFRGFAISAWRRGIGASRAIVRATLLFAIAHVVGIEGSTTAEALGLVAVGAGTRIPVAYALGLLYVRRDSLWAPIGLHAAFNATLLVLAHYAFVNGLA